MAEPLLPPEPAPCEDEAEERRRWEAKAAADEADLRAEIACEQAATTAASHVVALPRLVPVLSPPGHDVPPGAANGHAESAEPGSRNGHTAPRSEAPPDRAQAVVAALRLLYAPGEVFEVRILETERDGVVSGYFDDPDRAAAAVMTWNGRVPALYVTLNRLPPAILARANNRLKKHTKITTTDAEVTRRRWLLVDADEQSLTGISSSNEEHTAALARIRRIAAALVAEGWPEPILADSGNGGHALFPVDLPNDEAARLLLEHVLKSLAARFDDPPDALPRITLDTAVFNAGRLTKLYGTAVRKGDALPDRPHRWSRILSAPAWTTGTDRPAVTIAQLQAHIVTYPAANGTSGKKGTHGDAGSAGSTPGQVRAYLESHGVGIAEEKQGNQGQTIFVLEHCVFDQGHAGTSAAVQEWPSGARSYRCFHASCEGKTWGDVRDVLEGPSWHAKRGKQQNTGGDDAPRSLRVRAISGVAAQRTTWLFPGYLPGGELAALAGAGGAGKTSVALALAVAKAGGLPLPLGASAGSRADVVGPTGVLYMTAENHPAKVLRPRLEAEALRQTGGDKAQTQAILERIFIVQGVVTLPDGAPLGEDLADVAQRPDAVVLPRDTDLLRVTIREHAIGLVIVDPVISFSEHDLDVLHPADMRKLLDPLALLAQEEDIAVWALLHFTKAVGTAVIMRISLSRQMTDTARAVGVVLEDPNDAGQRWLAFVKGNLGVDPPAYSFRLEAVQHPAFNDELSAVVLWGETREAKADKLERDLAEAAAKRDGADPFSAKRTEAMQTKSPVRYEAMMALAAKLIALRKTGAAVVTAAQLETWRAELGFNTTAWSGARALLHIHTKPLGQGDDWEQRLDDPALEWLTRRFTDDPAAGS